MALDVEWASQGDVVEGSGQLVTELRVLPPFHGVSVTGALQVHITRTHDQRVQVTSDDNVIPSIHTVVRAGILHVYPASGVTLRPTNDIVVFVDATEIGRIDASAASVIALQANSPGTLRLDLSGASSATARGTARLAVVELSGASVFRGKELRVDSARVVASGASIAVLRVGRALQAWASGASSVRYLGFPDVEAHVSDASSIGPY